jgi:transcriptional regulator GlxA family with amidase domain
MSTVTKMTVVRYVWRCLRDEEVPRVSELAQIESMTAEHLSRAFRARYGERISDFMKAIQVRRAQRLLRTTDLSTTRIAYLCGFGTRRTFFRSYRRVTGQSPVEDAYADAGPRRRRPRSAA